MAEKTRGIALERIGTGEPLLLLHGTGGSRSVWAPVVDQLAPKHDVLLVDLPGHGGSDPPPADAPHTPIVYAELLARLLDELDLESAHAVGNSVGAWTALELAKLGRARSVVALAPAGLWPRRDPWRCTTQLWTQHKLGRTFSRLTPTLMRSDLGRTFLLRGTVAKPRQVPPEAAIEFAATYANTPTFSAHLGATRRERFREGHDITVPITVAWGEKERLIPAKARLRSELPAHARFVSLSGCGHVPMWDDPDLVARTILEGATQAAPVPAAD